MTFPNGGWPIILGRAAMPNAVSSPEGEQESALAAGQSVVAIRVGYCKCDKMLNTIGRAASAAETTTQMVDWVVSDLYTASTRALCSMQP